MEKELLTLTTIQKLSDKIKNEEVSPLELVEVCLERIKKFNPSLNSFITVLGDEARKDAATAEKEIRQGLYIGPLHGIPFSIKDVIYAEGVRCTAGSKIMANYNSKIDATSVAKMKKKARTLLEQAKLFGEKEGINIKIDIIMNTKVPEAIVEFAKINEIDLILVGTKDLTGLRFLLGSVSSKVITHATCPVLAIR